MTDKSAATDQEGTPVFEAPWQAQSFAMVLALHRRGLFSWPEWTDALARQIALAEPAGDSGDQYYHHWVAALEAIITEKKIVTGDQIASFQTAWQHAAERTRHGQPIDLTTEDFHHAD